MKIIHVLNTNSFSGAENVCITILENLKSDQNYSVTYVSLKGTIQEILDSKQIDFYALEKMNLKCLKKMIYDLKPDIIHCHDFTTSILVSLISKKIPVISHLHNNPSWIKKYNLKSILYRLTLHKYCYVLAVSQSVFREYVFSNKIKNPIVVSNPIDLSKIKGQKLKEKYDLIFLGRLTEQKDPLRFINIVAKLFKSNRNIRVAILGAGDLENECKNLIKINNLGNNIKLLGFKTNRFDYIESSKIMCITSKWEGFGLMAIESLALGVPVVTTSVGGLNDIVTQNCGIFCSDDSEFIKEIELLLNDSVLYKDKSESAVKRAKKLENIDEYMNLLKKLYLSIESERNI